MAAAWSSHAVRSFGQQQRELREAVASSCRANWNVAALFREALCETFA